MQMCVLTMSSKGDGICLSGYDLNNGRWIRIVSNDEGDAISRELMSKVHILDVIEFDVVRYVPIRWSRENVIVKNIKVIGKKTEYEIFIKTKLDSTEECIQYMEFKYHGNIYHLKITDLSFPYTSRDDLTGMILENVIVVCSVQGKLKPNSHCYKFACQIFDIKNKEDIIKNIEYKGDFYE